MTVPGKVLVAEDFSGPSLPKAWNARLQAECFRIVDGALRCEARPGTERTPCVITRLSARDVTVGFTAKFTEAGVLVLVIDGENPSFGGKTHLIKLELRTDRVTLFQKRGSAESKRLQTAANRKARAADEKIPQVTPEQLADDDFYRTEAIASAPLRFGVGEWHNVLLEISGNEIVAQVDAQPPLFAMATVADAAKSRMFFGISGRGTALIDNVCASENSRRVDWPETKARIVGEGATKTGLK